jgi:biotin carboxylase
MIPQLEMPPQLEGNDPASTKRGWVVLVESNTTGTGRLFAGRASAAGYLPVVLAAKPGRYPYLEQDHVPYLQCDTSSSAALQQDMAQLAAKACISGVFSSSEYFIETAAVLAQALGLPGADPASLRNCRNKWTQRRMLQAAGARTPNFRLATSVDSAVAALKEIPLPVVLKPTMGSGSVGVKLCRTAEEAAEHAAVLLQKTVNERGLPLPAEVLVEEYLSGEEFSAETLGGHVVGITRKQLSREPFFVETGHSFPADLPDEVQSSIVDTVRTGLRAMGLEWGPAHVELRLTPAGPVIIEINPRLAGGFIPELVRLARGVDMIRETLALVVGKPPNLQAAQNRYAAIKFLCPAIEGVIRQFAGLEDARNLAGVADIQAYRVPGETVRIEHDFRDRIGHVIALGDTEAQALRSAESAWNKITVEIEPQQ